MARDEVILRFDEVSFEHSYGKRLLDEATFSVRRGAKITLMGQNGAGKSTIFGLITGQYKAESGSVVIGQGVSIAIARQVISRNELDLTVTEFFAKAFPKKVYDIDPKIDAVLEAVNLVAKHDKVIKTFSGGQQARLLLAFALIQNPDLLLLDEPTNNLDKQGIEHLTKFLIDYQKTCIVISHDADFLNSFTEGVLYLDLHTQKLEWYVGNYNDVLKDITARIEKENRKNAQLAKQIQENKDKSNFFANKGGQLRAVAKRMREKAAEMEDEMVDVRKEDKTIRPFTIPNQTDFVGEALSITSLGVMINHKVVERKVEISLKKKTHLLLKGPNGIGKSTLLERLASGQAKGAKIASGVKVGYYRQDFSTLNFEDTVYESLSAVTTPETSQEELRSIAAGFLITREHMHSKIGTLSEGQKGLVAFARLVLERPGLLILDEPTNHINFRHLPIIAKALDQYEGAMILVSHVPEFVAQIRIDETLDLER
ncbi:MAG: ATP-binding cassette domain-containing protein [bacterium]|nr:ATP-binding cassette domain-containing protein [bacterium]